MDNPMDIELVANILSLANEVMFLEALELALAHVRVMLEDLQDNHAYCHCYPRFKQETKDLIHHIRFDLAVGDSWEYFMASMHPANPVVWDFTQFSCLNRVRDYINHDILWVLGGEHWGL